MEGLDLLERTGLLTTEGLKTPTPYGPMGPGETPHSSVRINDSVTGEWGER